MRTLALVLSIQLLGGCGSDSGNVFAMFSGRPTSTVVLIKQPVLLTPTALVLTPQEPMKVLGEWTSLCLSLRGDVPTGEFDRTFEKAMRGTKVTVYLTLSNGVRVPLRTPLPAQSAKGIVVAHDELAACAGNPCRSELPVGAQVSKVEVSSEPPLQVQGIFWESERGVNEKVAKPERAIASSASAARSSCSA